MTTTNGPHGSAWAVSATDHAAGVRAIWWNNAASDLDLAEGLGLNAIRVSVEWSRLEPEEGRWNTAALARYYALLRELRRRGMRPFVTLHHFSHPLWFEQRGGFLGADAVDTFSRFVFRTIESLREVCCDWVTINEPNVYGAFGYLVGEFPPGVSGELLQTLRVLSRLAQCHAAAYRIIHEYQPNANVGWAQNYVVFHPGTARYRDEIIARMFNRLFNESFFDLLRNGHVSTPWRNFLEAVPEVQNKLDFVGLNVYNRLHVTLDPRARKTLFARVFVPEQVLQGDSGTEFPYGECFPGAITTAVEYAASMKRPIYILENGVPDRSDRIRPWLLVQVLQRIHALLQSGHDIRGYFHWTLTDSFEWTEGWRLCFGLYELDPTTQQRRARPSAGIYHRIVRDNGVCSELLERYSDHACRLTAKNGADPGLLDL
jgi:beta-glucosidase